MRSFEPVDNFGPSIFNFNALFFPQLQRIVIDRLVSLGVLRF